MPRALSNAAVAGESFCFAAEVKVNGCTFPVGAAPFFPGCTRFSRRSNCASSDTALASASAV